MSVSINFSTEKKIIDTGVDRVQSNLNYPNPFGQGEIWNRSDKQKVRIMLTTPTRSIMHAKT